MLIRSDETLDVAVSGAGSMRTHLARPAVAGRFPGVLLFSEIYQVTDPRSAGSRRWLQEHCRSLETRSQGAIDSSCAVSILVARMTA